MRNQFLDELIKIIVYRDSAICKTAYFHGEDADTAKVLHAIVSDYRTLYPLNWYIWESVDKFIDEMECSLRDGEIDSFRESHKKCDLLVVDHIDDIAGRQRAQIEFHEIFDHVCKHGGQIITAGRMPPGQIQMLDDRIRTQLESGIVVKIRPEMV